MKQLIPALLTIALCSSTARAQVDGLDLPYNASDASHPSFKIENTADGATAIWAVTSGSTSSSNALWATASGSSGRALYASAPGGAVGVFVKKGNSSWGYGLNVSLDPMSTATGINVNNQGLARTLAISSGNPANTTPGFYSSYNGTGYAVQILGNNASQLLRVSGNGTGWAGWYKHENGKGLYVESDASDLGLHVKTGLVQIGTKAIPANYKMAVDGDVIVGELKVADPNGSNLTPSIPTIPQRFLRRFRPAFLIPARPTTGEWAPARQQARALTARSGSFRPRVLVNLHW